MHIFWKWHSTANQSYCHNNSALQTRFLFGYNMKGEQRLSFKLSLQEKTGPIKFSLNQDFIKERDLTNHLVNIFSRHKIWLSDHFIMCYLFKCTLTQLQFCFCKIFCFLYKLLKRIFQNISMWLALSIRRIFWKAHLLCKLISKSNFWMGIHKGTVQENN